MMRNWVVVKNGYYYRPGAHGYTANIEEAGRWTKAKALEYALVEPERISVKKFSEIMKSKRTRIVDRIYRRFDTRPLFSIGCVIWALAVIVYGTGRLFFNMPPGPGAGDFFAYTTALMTWAWVAD